MAAWSPHRQGQARLACDLANSFPRKVWFQEDIAHITLQLS